MSQERKPNRTQTARRAKPAMPGPVLALLKSFFCGAGAALLICAAAAFVFSRTELPLDLAGPAAFGAISVGALVSGLVLADCLARRRLLCGLGCGAFYALCLLIAALLHGTVPVLHNESLFLLSALLVCGTAGGAISAAFGTPHR